MEKARILIVEDEGIVALDIQNTLVQLGYQVCGSASTGDEALRLALDNQPDLILMDIRLAGEMDGIETAEKIHAGLDVPIVFLTAYNDQATLDRAKATQPFGYITKPLEVKDLQANIEISLYRHAMERRERQNANRFEQVVNTVAYGLVLLDENRLIQIANQQALDYLKTLSQSEELTIGDRLNHLNGRQIEEYMTLTGTPAQQTHEIVIDAPHERVFVLDVVPLTNSFSEPKPVNSGWVMAIQEITEARRRELAQRQQERLATVGRLTAGIAHEFGNILASILLSTQIVLQIENNLNPRSIKHLKRIGDQVHQANKFVAQVRDFSRQSYLERKFVDLIPMYETWIKLLEPMMPGNIELRFNCAQTSCVVDADSTDMQQILWNLALNARDALPNGGAIEIDLDMVAFDADSHPPQPELEDGEWVRVRIADNGLGISPEVLPYIFEPFYTTKEPGQGTGLGLAQVYGIVQQHNGVIHVSSVRTSGTTFTVFLPAIKHFNS